MMSGPEDTDLDDVDLAPTEIDVDGDEAEAIEDEGEPGGSNFV